MNGMPTCIAPIIRSAKLMLLSDRQQTGRWPEWPNFSSHCETLSARRRKSP